MPETIPKLTQNPSRAYLLVPHPKQFSFGKPKSAGHSSSFLNLASLSFDVRCPRLLLLMLPMYCIPLNLPRSLRLDPMYITLTFNSTTTLHPVTPGDRFSRTHSSRGIYFKPLPCRFYIIIIIISEPESLATSSPTEPPHAPKRKASS